MKKLDKLILGSFIGPFLLTFIVVDFILLTVNMLKYFDEIFGKGLGFGVYMELISYFVISISPMALPLAVLLSALMTFGNLGEHFELTAIKSSGISLLRALMPIGVFVLVLSFAAFYSNNYLVPKVNLKTFSLLYDIRMKSPALDIKEGVFYNGMPGYSIKVNEKIDDVRLRDVIIYDHTANSGNNSLILADSGRMEPFFNDRYMKLTLYSGYNYNEENPRRGIRGKPAPFTRTKFDVNEIVFSLDAFEMNRTPEKLWSSNRSIKNISEIKMDVDSMSNQLVNYQYYNYAQLKSAYSFFTKQREIEIPADLQRKKAIVDSLKTLQWKEKREKEQEKGGLSRLSNSPEEEGEDGQLERNPNEREITVNDTKGDVHPVDSEVQSDASEERLNDTLAEEQAPAETPKVDSASRRKAETLITERKAREEAIKSAYKKFTEVQVAKIDSVLAAGNYMNRAATIGLQSARTLKNNFSSNQGNVENLAREKRRFQISWYQKYTQAFACVVMFMIGAPLGAIIKKGGLGMPVLVSIIFFIIFYMLTITGEKWAKEGMANPLFGTWFSNLALLPIGFFFLRQARKDARIFESDVYYAFVERIKRRFNIKSRKK
ncbi:LptF/LptG family permease [Echinicola vietnamensis]|uniref:Putative permease n=1 Tax=Echinicola vietnamensis (strain DSM 17526 / LMG 23754 / KMM 6221) TaxID=926556 RepID=L0G296_ECHVK|nr:LptF/LptG family permease [Echinicola vietnamensis]AGA79652.1 putative permease [Echinicola vietnamensis DSM 17526]